MLTAGDEHSYGARDLGEPLHIPSGQRFLQEVDVKIVQRQSHLERPPPGPGTVAQGFMVLVGVDEDHQIVTNSLPHGLNDSQVVSMIGPMEPQLDGPEAQAHNVQGLPDTLPLVEESTGCRVCQDPVTT